MWGEIGKKLTDDQGPSSSLWFGGRLREQLFECFPVFIGRSQVCLDVDIDDGPRLEGGA